ncbi:hypothetical protein U9M48_034400 [Paspalum notatum var. saurae]|uniref:Uncharacterized protein n=1 Tax=Paspalum notatum var. saurae TaxID=547442 RepID=A0AAQ3U900_PASNO
MSLPAATCLANPASSPPPPPPALAPAAPTVSTTALRVVAVAPPSALPNYLPPPPVADGYRRPISSICLHRWVGDLPRPLPLGPESPFR